jgi:pantoate--beta-alanine ligase
MMEIMSDAKSWRALMTQWRHEGDRIGFCPTMGALHAGHLSLVEHAREQCDRVGVSIFVNPTQFNQASDLVAYPRPLEADLDMLRSAGVHAVFVPEVQEIYPLYPEPTSVRVEVEELGQRYEGADRPGHFSGMATVVSILLNLTQAHAAYFGEKDFQQLVIVNALVRDLMINTQIIGVPTLREAGGLAMSSRNVRLSEQGRIEAQVINQALHIAQEHASNGASVGAVEEAIRDHLGTCATMVVSYAQVVDPVTLLPVSPEVRHGNYRALVAGVIEGVRLLDNAEVKFPPS